MSEAPFTAAAARTDVDDREPSLLFSHGGATCKGCGAVVDMTDPAPHVCLTGPNVPKPATTTPTTTTTLQRPTRWIKLEVTSNSGKQLHCCTICGRTSPTPDRLCPAANETKSNRCYRDERATTKIEGLDDATGEMLRMRMQMIRMLAIAVPRGQGWRSWERTNVVDVRADHLERDVAVVVDELRRLRIFREEAEAIGDLAGSGADGATVREAMQWAALGSRPSR